MMSRISEATLTDCINLFAYCYDIPRGEVKQMFDSSGVSASILDGWSGYWYSSEESLDRMIALVRGNGISIGEPVNDPSDYCVSDEYTPIIVFWREYPEGDYPETVQFVIPKGFDITSYA